MTHTRNQQATAKLTGGDVLVTGGFDSVFHTLSSVDRDSITTRGWSPVAPMSVVRGNHTATTLYDGRVLVVGGCYSGVYLASAEVYSSAPRFT